MPITILAVAVTAFSCLGMFLGAVAMVAPTLPAPLRAFGFVTLIVCVGCGFMVAGLPF